MDLVSNVREGLRQRMDEVDWLDYVTRELAIEKVRSSILTDRPLIQCVSSCIYIKLLYTSWRLSSPELLILTRHLMITTWKCSMEW